MRVNSTKFRNKTYAFHVLLHAYTIHMFYIGETGKSLRTRFGMRRRAQATMKTNLCQTL